MSCDYCGGPLTVLGWFGRLVRYRCRNCGMDQSAPADEPEDEVYDPKDSYWQAVDAAYDKGKDR